MSLNPFFSLSPLSPYVYNYDAANPNATYAAAYLYTYGGHTSYGQAWNLTGQHSNDQILLGRNPVSDADQTIANTADDIFRRSAAWINFRGVHVSTTNQYLLLFRLARVFGSPIAQFFVGTQFVRGEALTQAPYDDIAILLDTPGDGAWVYISVRLAASGTSTSHAFFFKGVDCYLL